MRFHRTVALCFLILLSACSSKVAYDNLDWITYWYISDYIDLSDDQSREVKARLNDLLEWHRHHQLPEYRTQLVSLQQSIRRDSISAERVTEIMGFVQASWWQLRDAFVDDAVALLPMLTVEQTEQLFYELGEKNTEDLQDVDVEPEQRFQARYDRLEDLAKEYFGHIIPQQVLILELYVGATVDNRKGFLEGNRRMQLDLQNKILAYLSQPSAQALEEISYNLRHPEDYRATLFKQASLENRKQTAVVLSDLAATLSAEQKQHLISKLQDWIDVIDGLLP